MCQSVSSSLVFSPPPPSLISRSSSDCVHQFLVPLASASPSCLFLVSFLSIEHRVVATQVKGQIMEEISVDDCLQDFACTFIPQCLIVFPLKSYVVCHFWGGVLA